jgi:putative peptidoglycan lipid II flippase
LFADTLIASFLATGALSALYYADRLNQLPIGVIGIAVGTVLLPEMATRLAAGDAAAAHKAQGHAIELTLVLSIPCIAAFIVVPDLLMRALFMRGAFTAADAASAGSTLAAYAIGLLPFVLIRSFTATFFARGDTATPVKAALAAAGVNIAFKIALMGSLAQVGLAFATSIGAWVNLGLVIWLGWRAGLISFDESLKRSAAYLAISGLVLATVLWIGQRFVASVIPVPASSRELVTLLILVVIGFGAYAGTILLLLGPRWLKNLARRAEDVTSRPQLKKT